MKNINKCIDQYEYLNIYNDLLSSAKNELNNNFAVIANPTFSKQETVTFLYQKIKCSKQSNHFKHFLLFLPRLLKHLFTILYYSIKYRVKSIPKNSIYFRSWLEPRCFSKGGLIDEHFRKLPHEIVKSNKVIIGLHPYDYVLLKKLDKKVLKSPFILTIGLLSIKDILIIFFRYLRESLLKINKTYSLKGQNITNYINDSLLLDYLKFRSLTAYIDRSICEKLNDFELKLFIYVFENQSWEKVCCDFFYHKKTKCIAIQGSGFSKLFLNFFPSKIDYKKSNYPDIILTVGELFTKFLKEETNITVPIKTFGALRFSYPSKNSRYLIAKNNFKIHKKILYAFSVHSSQYENIVNDLVTIFGDTNIQVDLKFHPQYEQLKKLKTSLPKNFQTITDFDKHKMNMTYDLVLFNDNSFGLECLIFGLKSFQYNHSGCFIDDRYFYFNHWNTKIDFDGLKKIKSKIITNKLNKNFNQELISNYINKLYKPYKHQHKKFQDYIKTGSPNE